MRERMRDGKERDGKERDGKERKESLLCVFKLTRTKMAVTVATTMLMILSCRMKVTVIITHYNMHSSTCRLSKHQCGLKYRTLAVVKSQNGNHNQKSRSYSL